MPKNFCLIHKFSFAVISFEDLSKADNYIWLLGQVFYLFTYLVVKKKEM